MLTTSVIIVLREVLEAALLISLLAGLSHNQQLSLRWLIAGVAGGIGLAIVYAFYLATISDWFDGVGQEVVNGLQLGLVFLLLLLINVLISMAPRRSVDALLLPAMAMAVALIFAHEGAELLVYWSGMLSNPDYFVGVLTGSAIGLGIGFSIGALFYYLLIAGFAERSAISLQGLLALVAAGLNLQASQFFIQADWLVEQQPVMDFSAFIPEQSVVGQLLYALLGYEATPGPIQIAVYLLSLALLIILPLWAGKFVGAAAPATAGKDT